MVSLLAGLVSILFMLTAATGVALGSGYVMTLFLPLTLFQATVIFIGLSGVYILVNGMMELQQKLSIQNVVLKQMAGWDDDDQEFEEEQEKVRIQEVVERTVSRQVKKVMQNALCQCGSGRKFRYCCMAQQANKQDKEVVPF